MRNKYYSLKNILSKNALYNIIFGERSNGKTYAVLKHALQQYWEHSSQLAIIRRWREDFAGKRGASMFDALEHNGEIYKITGGEWEYVHYYGGRWWLARNDKDGNRETAEEPFAFGFAISSQEHDKSTSYPRIRTVLFDEFLTRTAYLPDEFVLFMNTLSTIIRDRTDVQIFMLGNTVNKYCPYFKEMGLKHIKNMNPGDISLYRYGDSDLTVAVEYTKPNKQGKDSDMYFAFDNPKLSMITGGAWEIDIYPHLPFKYKPKEIIFTYFICFAGDILQCEIIQHEEQMITFIHRKTTELKNPDGDLIFSTESDPRPNWRKKINRPTDRLTQKIADQYKRDKIFYADNETGEIMRNYLIWCNSSR